MRAVFAETFGGFISGNGRSFNETLLRERDLTGRRAELERGEVERAEVELVFFDFPLDPPAFTVVCRDLDPVDLAAGDFAPFDFERAEPVGFARVDLAEELESAEVFEADVERFAFALRRSLRCVFVIASINSSFRIPCQPAIP